MELDSHIDFEIFREELEKAFDKPEPKGPGGRPSYDVVMMFKMLILQRLYNLSDEQLEFQVTDRLSFTRFLNIALGQSVPDFSRLFACAFSSSSLLAFLSVSAPEVSVFSSARLPQF